jgi:hypothetical protein
VTLAGIGDAPMCTFASEFAIATGVGTKTVTGPGASACAALHAGCGRR